MNRAKRCICLAIAFFTAFRAFALIETVGGIEWEYTVDDGFATISGIFRSTTGTISIPSSLGGWPVTNIGDDAFSSCRGLTCVTIPDCVTHIAYAAFYGCTGLTGVTFLGNAPSVGSSAFYSVNSSCIASVSPKSTGWSVGVGEKWNGLMLKYWPEVLAEMSSDAEVGEVMAMFADSRLAAQVSNVAEYEAFKAWVEGTGFYQPNVLSSPYTAAAYALGAEKLFENEPKIEIDEVTVGADDSGALGTTRPTMTVSVAVKDGERAVAVDAAKVAAMFEATTDLGDWTGEARLTPTVTVVDDGPGALGTTRPTRFAVAVGNGAARSAFLRIRK